MRKIISIMLVCIMLTTTCFAGTFTKTSNGSSISINVDQGKTILLKAREIFGKIFTGWTITGATVSDASLSEQTITMPSGNVSVTANYATPYTITVEQSANGVISPSTVTVAEGSSKTFSITPNTGHAIEDVLVDGVSVLGSCANGTGDEKIYTFSNITGNHTITAIFSSTGSSGGSASIVIPTIAISDKTTNSITVSTSAVDPNGGNLVYKLYANGTLASTSTEVASGNSVNLTASSLSQSTLYSVSVACYKNGILLGVSPSISTITKCSGTGANECVWENAAYTYWCFSCNKPSSDRSCPSCNTSMSSSSVGEVFKCIVHQNNLYQFYKFEPYDGGSERYQNHCNHTLTTIHDVNI